jgi:TRAP-type mannitol/chloroaromatic compound transport system permease large subunit
MGASRRQRPFILVLLPILHSVIEGLKYAPAWFGALIVVSLQTVYLSPPVAMSASDLKAVVPQWPPQSLLMRMESDKHAKCRRRRSASAALPLPAGGF